MCDKAVNFCTFVFGSVGDCYKTQIMCNKVASEEPFLLKLCLDRYKTQRVCDTIKLLMLFCQHQNLFLIGLLRTKCLKNLIMLYFLMMI